MLKKREELVKDLAINADKKLHTIKTQTDLKNMLQDYQTKKRNHTTDTLAKQGKKSDGDKSAYKQSPADKVAKTKPSVHTKKYKQMFGEG